MSDPAAYKRTALLYLGAVSVLCQMVWPFWQGLVVSTLIVVAVNAVAWALG